MASSLNGTGVTFSNSSTQATATVVRQVVQTIKVDSFTMSGTTPTDVTGFSASITPFNSSSKILVFVTMGIDGYNQINLARLLRDGSVIANSTAGSSQNGFYNGYGFGSNTGLEMGSIVYQDSPATGSAVTYKVQIWNASGGTTYFNRTANGAAGSSATITLMEVLG